MADYDVVVIGAGPGGYVAASALHSSEEDCDRRQAMAWGVCLNVGCIPSKALLKNAEVAHLLRERGKEFGFQVEGLKLDYSAAVKRSRRFDRLVKGVGFLMKKNGVDVHLGPPWLRSRGGCRTGSDGERKTLTTRDIIVATGSSTAMLPGVQADGKLVLTYLEAILRSGCPSPRWSSAPGRSVSSSPRSGTPMASK